MLSKGRISHQIFNRYGQINNFFIGARGVSNVQLFFVQFYQELRQGLLMCLWRVSLSRQYHVTYHQAYNKYEYIDDLWFGCREKLCHLFEKHSFVHLLSFIVYRITVLENWKLKNCRNDSLFCKLIIGPVEEVTRVYVLRRTVPNGNRNDYTERTFEEIKRNWFRWICSFYSVGVSSRVVK